MFKIYLHIFILLFSVHSYSSEYSDQNLDRQNLCDGLPRLKNIATPYGFCLGLVDNGTKLSQSFGQTLVKTSFKFPRSLVEGDPNHFILVDQGSKDSLDPAGQIFEIIVNSGIVTRKLLASRNFNPFKIPTEAFFRPAHIAKFNNVFYFATARAIFSFEYANGKIFNFNKVIGNIQIGEGDKELGSELHPLKVFIFDSMGNMIVNIGSATNNCMTNIVESESAKCAERERRAQLRFYYRNQDNSYNPNYVVIAKGLRNSMALAFHPINSNWLFQGENSRDAMHKVNPRTNIYGDGKTLPPEELNILNLDKVLTAKRALDFGWPYCYGNNLNSPEFPNLNCKLFDVPYRLLPAHSAPLGMIFHSGNNWPLEYKHGLLMSWHGYEYTGHRIAMILNSGHSFLPEASIHNLVWNWGVEGRLPLGTPVELYESMEGSVMITEDNNHSVWKLFYDASLPKNNGSPMDLVSVEDDYLRIRDYYTQNKYEELKAKRILRSHLNRKYPPTFSLIQNQLIDKHCAECHSLKDSSRLLMYNDIRNSEYLVKSKLVVPFKPSASPFYTYVESKAMPLSGMPDQERAQLLKLVKKWIMDGAPKSF